MPKMVLYIIIFLLFGALTYVVLFGSSQDESDTQTDITFGETDVTDNHSATSTEEESDDEEAEEPTQAQAPARLAITGTLQRFEEVPDRRTGELTIYAFINDGTEVISVDMNQVVRPGVSAPEDQLGLSIGQTVTVRGDLEDGVFVVTEIE